MTIHDVSDVDVKDVTPVRALDKKPEISRTYENLEDVGNVPTPRPAPRKKRQSALNTPVVTFDLATSDLVTPDPGSREMEDGGGKAKPPKKREKCLVTSARRQHG